MIVSEGMTPLLFLARVALAYVILQAVIIAIVKFLPRAALPGQVRRVVFVNIVNHVFYIGAALMGIAIMSDAAKLNATGAIWAVPIGVVAGFFFYVSIEVAARLGRKAMGQVLFDLQELAVSPVFPRSIMVPGIFNFLLLKPLGEELLFRGVMVGVLSTQIHWGIAILITVIVENLRYPQLTWFGRNTLRAAIPGLIFLISPTILLTLAMGMMAHAIGAAAQISRVRKLAETIRKGNPDFKIEDVIAEHNRAARNAESGNEKK